jgi:hypothetical protein
VHCEWVNNDVPAAQVGTVPGLITGLGVGAVAGTELCVGVLVTEWLAYLKGQVTYPSLPTHCTLCLMHLSQLLVNCQYPFALAI